MHEVSVDGTTLGAVDVDTVTLFFALLAGLASLVTLSITGSAATGDPLGINATIRPVAIELAAAVALISMFGSLYLSEIVGYEPCRLCWIQRGFMYPAAILLVLALVISRGQTGRGRPNLAKALAGIAGLLALIGLPVSIFHRYEQAAGGIGEFCDQDNPCSLRWVEEFGFVTIPVMAGIGFLTVATLVALALRRETTGTATGNQNSTKAQQAELEHH